ncbi:epimerase [Kocuria flava]|uniref:Epimerase n=1 Tax=Kocuria flava TaxID=446860 RepID=A0A0U2YYC5_9MICC|nr:MULTISPECIES: NAD-dependent epimerase/dehydratase family protein [Kocuria]ALU40481.1 epimerase [Kocuria flava]MCD1145680.1 NAD-dependent epimerase/dehydratase family protein [Kocuria sp. LUK]
MTSRTWAVLGATGFVGSATVARLQADGQRVVPVAAPRLASGAHTVHHLLQQAGRLESVLDYLAESFAGADVVLNAAGLAAPDQRHEESLIGANALLPVLVALAARRTSVRRVLHVSSAAVQGDVDVLDETPTVRPFSPYSFSKALGESALLKLRRDWVDDPDAPGVTVLRATSVQGSGRRTTARLVRFASSPVSSVAGDGTAHTPVTSVHALAEFTSRAGRHAGTLPPVVLQPWEGATTASILRDAGRREPLRLPAPLCRLVVDTAFGLSALAGHRWHGLVRRLEVTWFGQRQARGWAEEHDAVPEPRIGEVLRQAHLAAGRRRRG